MSEALEWLQLPPNRVAEALKNKQLTAKATKIVEIARSIGTEPTKNKVSGLYFGISEQVLKLHFLDKSVEFLNVFYSYM